MKPRVDHIGIAVRSIDERIALWRDVLGLEPGGIETVESEGVRVAFLEAGDTRIELLEPLSDDSTVARYLAKRGEGIHHLTLEVGDIRRALDAVSHAGVRVIGEAPRIGAGGARVAFLHPASCGGVLVELVERGGRAATHGGGDSEVDDMVPGAAVLAYLRDPVEKLFGILRRIGGEGVVLEAIDLASFDDWLAQIERSEETIVGPSVQFVPMARIERLLLDRPSGTLPSLGDRFRAKVGRSLRDYLG